MGTSSKSDSGPSIIATLIAGILGGAATALALKITGKDSYSKKGNKTSSSRSRVLGVIPARYASTRFPGKPLVDILGKPMIVRTYEQAKLAKTLTKVVVATDNDKIKDVCEKAGAEVIMTSESCPNGTIRCAEALEKLGSQFDIVINIQGDEPLIEPEIIDGCVEALQSSPDAVYSTPCTPLDPAEATQRQRVKVIMDQEGYAIYFSRGLLPHNKDGVPKDFPYWLHLGLQCYDANFIKVYTRLPDTPLMLQEDLEQLKVIENGYKVKVIKVDHAAHGVDKPEDVESIVKIMKEKGIQ